MQTSTTILLLMIITKDMSKNYHKSLYDKIRYGLQKIRNLDLGITKLTYFFINLAELIILFNITYSFENIEIKI
jgi:hypothetical protein